VLSKPYALAVRPRSLSRTRGTGAMRRQPRCLSLFLLASSPRGCAGPSRLKRRAGCRKDCRRKHFTPAGSASTGQPLAATPVCARRRGRRGPARIAIAARAWLASRVGPWFRRSLPSNLTATQPYRPNFLEKPGADDDRSSDPESSCFGGGRTAAPLYRRHGLARGDSRGARPDGRALDFLIAALSDRRRGHYFVDRLPAAFCRNYPRPRWDGPTAICDHRHTRCRSGEATRAAELLEALLRPAERVFGGNAPPAQLSNRFTGGLPTSGSCIIFGELQALPSPGRCT